MGAGATKGTYELVAAFTYTNTVSATFTGEVIYDQRILSTSLVIFQPINAVAWDISQTAAMALAVANGKVTLTCTSIDADPAGTFHVFVYNPVS